MVTPLPEGEITVDLRRLASKAKEIVDKRGGMQSVKEDAEELKDIAGRGGSLGDKAKAAAEAVKDPGAGGPTETPEADREPRERERPREPGRQHHRERGQRPGR
jgi:hypothetical protein